MAIPLRRRRRRIWPWILLALVMALLIPAFLHWRSESHRGGQEPVEPFRIAGNLYYVGANDVTAFLITGPEGHILIDGGYPKTPPLIMRSISKLGFKITDVKILLNSHAHFDHAGGLAALKKASGAELWISERDAETVETGGARDPTLPLRFLADIGLLSYPAAKVDHRFKDGEVVRLGPIELTANVTAGHTRGCTSWSFPVVDHGRRLNVVSICSLGLPPLASLVPPETYPGIRRDFERSLERLRGLPVDIFLTAHAREFGRWRKFQESKKAEDPVEPFIDPEGYYNVLDKAEAKYRKLLAEQL